MKTALLLMIFVAAASAALASPYRPYQDSDQTRWAMLEAQILQIDHMIRAWQPKRYTWEIFSEGRTLPAEESTDQFLDF